MAFVVVGMVPGTDSTVLSLLVGFIFVSVIDGRMVYEELECSVLRTLLQVFISRPLKQRKMPVQFII